MKKGDTEWRIRQSPLGEANLYRRYLVIFKEPVRLRTRNYYRKEVERAELVFFEDSWGRLCYRDPERGSGYWCQDIYPLVQAILIIGPE